MGGGGFGSVRRRDFGLRNVQYTRHFRARGRGGGGGVRCCRTVGRRSKTAILLCISASLSLSLSLSVHCAGVCRILRASTPRTPRRNEASIKCDVTAVRNKQSKKKTRTTGLRLQVSVTHVGTHNTLSIIPSVCAKRCVSCRMRETDERKSWRD